ncbi:hypothetical protein [Flavobacterium selenitireducens]|uniref:hypothetical protein n=1 Tax=Flavobacterium selenitireducens TaxID=2722704 RepID=UPI00168AA3E2|nr:hypothetical protein [Flavobacterium selenitireducens]MBD3582548.1 hypothetical protein [Flavobacterium selenitireducens]
MSRFFLLSVLVASSVSAQVGIGTTNPSASAILQLESTNKTFVPPRMTNAQMLAIVSPINGSMIFNTTHNAMFVRTSNGWKNFFETSNASVVLNKVFASGNGQVATVNNNYTNFPLTASDAMTVDNAIYTVLGAGRVRVSETGVYMISGSFSVTNMPSGIRKYIIAVYQNATLVGYLTRGTANLDVADEWGTSGSLSIPANANDIIELKYVLNNGGTALDARIFNMGVTKLK